jgi:uncharacterized protein (DUF1778 family)
MPILTIRMTEQEMNAVKQAARRHGNVTSEFSRNAILTAARPASPRQKRFPLGEWRGRVTYKQAMKLLRD